MDAITNSKAADVSGLRKAASHALKGFSRSKVRQAFETMAQAKVAGDTAQDSKADSALTLCRLAVKFRKANPAVTDVNGTIVPGWRDHLAGVITELAVAGNKFAKLTPAKEDKPAKAVLTGYGNNVASIAKGCLEHSIDPDALTDDNGQPDVSYKATLKAVQAARDEARRLNDPDYAARQDMQASVDDTWSELRTLVFGLKSLTALTTLRDSLIADIASVQSQIADQLEIAETLEDEEMIEAFTVKAA